MKNYLLLCLFFFLTVILVSAQNKQIPDSSNSTKEERITAYFKAFNSGNEKAMGAFFYENVASASLKQRPLEQRLQFYRQVRSEIETVAIKRILRINDDEINASAQSQKGDWFNFIFMFEPEPPNKLIGVKIERTRIPAESGLDLPASRNQPLLTEMEFLAKTGNYLNEMVKNDDFSGVVLIAKNEKPIFTNAFGLANKDTQAPNRLDTKFNLGSLNKSFTQIAIGQLVRQGKISLDDKLGKYLPDYPNKEAVEKVTIRHLVLMTSGIGDIFGDKYLATPKKGLRNIKDFIPLFSDQPLAFEPGTRTQYSNGGYLLLGAIIEKVTGQSYYDYVRENISKPLGMTNTEFYEADQATPNMAEGYTTEGVKAGDPQNARRNNLDTRSARGSSAGGGYSTAEDLLKFSLALQSGKIQLPDESLARKDSHGNFKGIGLAGGSPGINATFEITPDGYSIIILSNYDPPSAEKVGRQIKNYLGQLKK